MSLKIEAVTVCVDFSDLLAVTLEMNRGQFDRHIIVTTEDDLETQEVARKYRCWVKLLDRRFLGKKFNKGRAINAGLREANLGAWLCHVDADVVLPVGLRDRLEKWLVLADIVDVRQRETIVGMARWMVQGREQWEEFKRTWDTSKLELEPPRVDYKHIPVGFWQLWHSQAKQVYPNTFDVANSSDLVFGKQFRHKRQIPERCFHLASGKYPKGVDWAGRVSDKF